MRPHTFDTHEYIKALEKSGLTKEQAELIVQGLLKSRQYDSAESATIKCANQDLI
jgi:hypothetical protein